MVVKLFVCFLLVNSFYSIRGRYSSKRFETQRSWLFRSQPGNPGRELRLLLISSVVKMSTISWSIIRLKIFLFKIRFEFVHRPRTRPSCIAFRQRHPKSVPSSHQSFSSVHAAINAKYYSFYFFFFLSTIYILLFFFCHCFVSLCRDFFYSVFFFSLLPLYRHTCFP